MVALEWTFANRLTNNADLPDFDKGILDVLDAGQILVQVRFEYVIALRVAFCDGSEDPVVTRSMQLSETAQ